MDVAIARRHENQPTIFYSCVYSYLNINFESLVKFMKFMNYVQEYTVYTVFIQCKGFHSVGLVMHTSARNIKLNNFSSPQNVSRSKIIVLVLRVAKETRRMTFWTQHN